MSRCLVIAATTPLSPPRVPSFARNTCLNPEETGFIYLFLFFIRLRCEMAGYFRSFLCSVIYIIHDHHHHHLPLSPPLPSSFHMFLFSSPLTPSAPHLPSPPLRYCLFEFAVSIVFPSSAASPVTEHRCNYAPIISVTHAHHTQTRRQLGRQAGKQVPERASVSGAKSTKTKHK